MGEKYCKQFFYLLCVFAFSCGTDDGAATLSINTNPDSVVLAQNSNTEIFIFQNDENIPSNGQLSITNPSRGTVTVNDFNNTPNNPSDDSLIYTTNANVVGEDIFQYTICDDSGNCKTENVSVTITSLSVVNSNLEQMPYQTLSEYNFFQGDIKDLNPSYGLVPYTLNSTLFSDYAKKKRFIWMPNNVKAGYINDDEPLEFPLGAILIKTFYYDNVVPSGSTQILETRLMIRKSEGWVFANYIWNEAQNEAILDMGGSFVDIEWQQNGEIKSAQYRIPAGPECHTCHKVMEVPEPIGPKPRNLNLDYNYSGEMVNQLDKLINQGYLENNLPAFITSTPNYNDASQSLEHRVRAYLDINCAHCHSEETHCDYRPMRLSFTDTNNSTNMGVCVSPDTDLGEGLGNIIEPGDARNSVMHFRLNSVEQSHRMPLLGRTLRHDEGVNLIEEWIDNLNIDCN